MLNRFYVNPILPAQDGDRPKVLPRRSRPRPAHGPTDDPMVFGAASGSSIGLSEMPDRVTPPYPVISFMVTGIEQVVAGLKARGATFQPPAPASFAGVEGKASGDVMDFDPAKSAFLNDSEGNLIALNEFLG